VRRFADETPPGGPLLAVRTADLADKEALLVAGQRGFFTIAQFDGYAAVLIQLATVDPRALREAVTEVWLGRAPAPLAKEYLLMRRSIYS
jgi:hypothetical protein